MNEWTDQQLLGDYARQQSEAAFGELVRRHVDWVHTAAWRIVGDASLAQDVTQSVFVALAQNAARLADHPVLCGWLHRTARNLAAKTVRSDARRRAREQEAATMNRFISTTDEPPWEHLAPHLDAALGALRDSERNAILLRFFEKKSARDMARILGISDDAAQKRVSRALAQLRAFLAKRGVAVGTGALAIVLSANAVQAAPAGLAASISTATALAAPAPLTHATTKIIIMTTTTKAMIAAVCGAAAIAITVWSRHSGGSAEPSTRPDPAPDQAHGSAAAKGPHSPRGSATRHKNPFQVPRLSDEERTILAANPAAALAARPDHLDLLVSWAAMDPAAALAWADAQKDSRHLRSNLLGAIAAGILIKDGAGAMNDFIAEHIADPGLLPKYQNRTELLSHTMFHLGRDDSADAAMAILTELRDRAAAGGEAADGAPPVGKLASSLVLGTKGGADDQARAIDYLEAKGIGVELDYWSFQAAFDADPRYWADWAWKRDSDLLTDIVQAWHREHPAEASAWIADRLPPADPRRGEIDERITP